MLTSNSRNITTFILHNANRICLKGRISDANAEPDLPKSDMHCRWYKLSDSEDQKRITQPEPNHISSIRPIEAA